jgi:hypothetical protein
MRYLNEKILQKEFEIARENLGKNILEVAIIYGRN